MVSAPTPPSLHRLRVFTACVVVVVVAAAVVVAVVVVVVWRRHHAHATPPQ
jgi:hypothetical protein